MFDGFWQLVMEQNVGLIVMITRLEEKGRKKAEQYWPTKRRKEMVLAGGQTRVSFLSEQLCPDTEDLYKRSFRVSRDGETPSSPAPDGGRIPPTRRFVRPW